MSLRHSPRSHVVAFASAALLLGSLAAQSAGPAVLLHYAATALQAGTGVADLVAADVDGDGDLDLVTADRQLGSLLLLRNTGHGAFVQQGLLVGNEPTAIAALDVDGDGDLDLAVGCRTELRVLRNDGAGNFAPGAVVAFASNDLAPVGVRAADVDVDGRMDAIVGFADHRLPTGGSTGGVAVAFGDGAGQFLLAPTHALPLPAHRLVAADFDGDGRIDVAELGGAITANRVAVAFGGGNGAFVDAPVSYAAGLYASGLTAGDWDGDGAADLAVGGKYSVIVLHNDGSGAFAAGQVLNPGNYVKGLAAGDFDGDGDTDLVATSGTALAARVYANDGTGTFALAASLPASLQTTAVAFADVDGDGHLDVLAGDSTTGALTIGTSRVVAASYGGGRANSAGTTPSLWATGSLAVGGQGLQLHADHLIVDQPVLLAASALPGAMPLLGGTLLVAPVGEVVALVASHGSGAPRAGDGAIGLFVSGAQLATVGVGARVYLQVVAGDPWLADHGAAFSNGLWVEVTAP